MCGTVEVQEQPERMTTEFQVREQLRTVDRKHSLDALDFEDEALFDDKVHAICGFQLDTLVDNREPDLLLDVEAGLDHRVMQACVAGAFEDTGAERAVNIHRTTDDSVARGIRFEEGGTHCRLCVLCVHRVDLAVMQAMSPR